MGVLEKLPTFLTVGVLVIIFVCLKRQARSARLTLWTVGWTLVFIHFLMQLLEPDHAAVSSLLSAIDSGSLQAAAVVFLVSVSVLVDDYAKRTLLLLALGVPSVVVRGLRRLWRAGALAFCVVPDRLFRRQPRSSSSGSAGSGRCPLAAITLRFARSPEHGPIRAALGEDRLRKGRLRYWALDLVFQACLFAAARRTRRMPRSRPSLLSPAMLTIAGGFFCWGAVFPIGLLLDRVAPNFIVPVELWDAPKFFVAFGMILAVVEAKSESITGMQHKAAALNCQLERFSTITSRLLGGGRPDAICPAIASAITEVSNFTVAVVLLEDADRTLQVAGHSGLSADSVEKLHAQTAGWTLDHIKTLCSRAPVAGKNSYMLPADETMQCDLRRKTDARRGSEEILIPLYSGGGACLGCIRLAAPRDPSMIDALELSRIEMLAGDLAVAVELKALHTQLMWSEKLAALGQLMAGSRMNSTIP